VLAASTFTVKKPGFLEHQIWREKSFQGNLELLRPRQMYFQHDGAPPHYTRHVRDYLNESFLNRWLGRGGPVAWPPRSPDLTPLDYYHWGHMKTLVYESKVDSRAVLRDRIFGAAEHIRSHPDIIASATHPS
jgi:hypothetical protein